VVVGSGSNSTVSCATPSCAVRPHGAGRLAGPRERTPAARRCRSRAPRPPCSGSGR
jgi:hypothetical protein